MAITTFLSDLGMFDGSPALARALVLDKNPHECVIDISHGIEPHHLHQAAYVLESNGPDFPKKTVHILLLDLFDLSPSQVLVSLWQDQYLIAPDNGIFALLSSFSPMELRVFPTDQPLKRFRDWVKHAADLIYQLRADPSYIDQLELYQAKKQPQPWRPIRGEHFLEGHIIYVDRYENVILNIRREDLEAVHAGPQFRIELMRQVEVLDLHTEYATVREGEKFARFNRAGYLEIGIKKGSAASLLGLKMRREKNLVYQSIKLLFNDHSYRENEV